MLGLDAHVRRTPLPIVTFLLAAAAACAPAAARDPAAALALEYLRTTKAETGVDVLVSVEVYGAWTGDPRAAEVVQQARARILPADLERYGALLGSVKPAFPDARASKLEPPITISPAADIPDDRSRTCPLEVLSCDASASCIEFASRDASGTALTHQALWLVFAHWRGCRLPIDVDGLRRRYAGRLLAEIRADPTPSDLFFERLALLATLGYASTIDPAWIEALRASQRPEGCFPADAAVACHPHPTALALWVLGSLHRGD